MERNIMFLKRKIFQRKYDKIYQKMLNWHKQPSKFQNNSKTEGILLLRYESTL